MDLDGEALARARAALADAAQAVELAATAVASAIADREGEQAYALYLASRPDTPPVAPDHVPAEWSKVDGEE